MRKSRSGEETRGDESRDEEGGGRVQTDPVGLY